jgi:hypothetical protein
MVFGSRKRNECALGVSHPSDPGAVTGNDQPAAESSFRRCRQGLGALAPDASRLALMVGTSTIGISTRANAITLPIRICCWPVSDWVWALRSGGDEPGPPPQRDASGVASRAVAASALRGPVAVWGAPRADSRHLPWGTSIRVREPTLRRR